MWLLFLHAELIGWFAFEEFLPLCHTHKGILFSHFHSKMEIGSFFHLCSVDLLANTCDDVCEHLSYGSCMLLQLQMLVVLKRFVELVQIMILWSFDFCTGCVHSRGCPYTRTLRTVFQYATFSHSDYEPWCSGTLACWVRCCSVSFSLFLNVKSVYSDYMKINQRASDVYNTQHFVRMYVFSLHFSYQYVCSLHVR